MAWPSDWLTLKAATYAHCWVRFCMLAASAVMLAGCTEDVPLTPQRYQASDQVFDQIVANVNANSSWRKITEIDHSRLGEEVGSSMPPARVLIFSAPKLETAIILEKPLAALDLPLRILAYEETPGGVSRVIFNRYTYLQSRYGLSAQPSLGQEYEKAMAQALRGVPADRIAQFTESTMQPDGVVTIESNYDFGVTLQKVKQAIAAQSDTVTFASVDFKQQASELGIDILPSTMILFGAPGPGANAMRDALTLGLDAFCQKFLIWQDESGRVHLSFNDLLALAERQDVSISIALRVIDYRLSKVFREALE
jgi:uncharacterized protein (DUF302 family)